MRFFKILTLLLLSVGCSCGSGSSRGVLRIGIDPNWYPLDFGPQTSYVNGYTEDLLLEMARYTGIEFEKIPASWDNLLDGLKEGKYDAIFTSMPPYEYNKAKFDFSANFLELGPVLVLPADAPETKLEKMDGSFVGILANDPAVLILEKHPKILIRTYSSIPDLLDATVAGDVQGALLNQIPAVNFVGDLYAGKLKISGKPMTDAGLHLASPKGEQRLVKAFNHGLESLQKKKKIDPLLQKWDLSL